MPGALGAAPLYQAGIACPFCWGEECRYLRLSGMIGGASSVPGEPDAHTPSFHHPERLGKPSRLGGRVRPQLPSQVVCAPPGPA